MEKEVCIVFKNSEKGTETRTTCLIVNLVHKDLLAFFDDAAVLFVAQVDKTLFGQKAFKIIAVLLAHYLKIGEDKPEEKNFQSNPKMKRSTTLRILKYGLSTTKDTLF